jgi:opacity protein-like surface antigen
MKRTWWAVFVAATLAGAAGTPAPAARAGTLGLAGGVYGGMSFPVLQDDQGQGPLFGARLPVRVLPLLTVEPFYTTSALGDQTIEASPGFSVTREGSDVTTYGVNALFPFGTKTLLYPFVGIGSARFERTGEDETFTSFAVGLGLGVTLIPKLTLDVRGELQAASTGETSRKMVNLTLGATYSIFASPQEGVRP